MVIVVHDPAHEGLRGIEGENLAPLAQEDGLAVQVGAQGVDGLGLRGDLDGIDASGGPRGVIVRVSGLGGGLALFLGFLGRSGGGGGSRRDALLGIGNLGRIKVIAGDHADVLIQVLDDLLPVAGDDMAHAGPLAHALFAGVVVGAAGNIAQNGVGGEEDGGVLCTGDVGKRGGHLQVAGHRGYVLVARATSQCLRHADEVILIALGRGDAVRIAASKLVPLRVVQQIVLGARLHEAQQLGG